MAKGLSEAVSELDMLWGAGLTHSLQPQGPQQGERTLEGLHFLPMARGH